MTWIQAYIFLFLHSFKGSYLDHFDADAKWKWECANDENDRKNENHGWNTTSTIRVIFSIVHIWWITIVIWSLSFRIYFTGHDESSFTCNTNIFSSFKIGFSSQFQFVLIANSSYHDYDLKLFPDKWVTSVIFVSEKIWRLILTRFFFNSKTEKFRCWLSVRAREFQMRASRCGQWVKKRLILSDCEK